jgi:hypothetical protein
VQERQETIFVLNRDQVKELAAYLQLMVLALRKPKRTRLGMASALLVKVPSPTKRRRR